MIFPLLAFASLFLAFFALLGVEILRRRVVNYRRAFTYDLTADYELNYDPALGCIVDLDIDSRGIAWPTIEQEWQSAFVELSVQSDILGWILDPCIQMQLGTTKVRHYIERGGSGRRFFNVTDFLESTSAAGSVIALRGLHAAWRTGKSARLHLLRKDTPPHGPLLVLAPHPDDAEIAAFGLLSLQKSWVVTITTGDAGPSLYGEFFDDALAAHAEKARIRTWDSLSIPRMAGIPANQIINLGYFDGTLGAMLLSPDESVSSTVTGESDIANLRVNPFDQGDSPRQATWRHLVADMRQLLINIRPAAIVLPHPQLDPHPDHQCTTIAMLEALMEMGLGQGLLLFYANHLHGTELYPYGPNDGIVSIPPMHDARVFFQSILSIPLDRRTRLRKQVALEAHHDLIAPPVARSPSLPRLLLCALRAPYIHLVRANNDYARRSVRPNELFFTADYDQAETIRREFVARFTSASIDLA